MSRPEAGMRQVATRQPTHAEAVQWVMSAQSRQYRRECVKYWREQYGDVFADQVEDGVRKRWGKRGV